MNKVIINQKGAQRIKLGHPWVFRSDVIEAPEISAGEIVSVFCASQFLGQAFFNPKSQITLRIITRTGEEIDQDLWKKRIDEAIKRRGKLLETHQALRLIYAESDLIPSLIVDRYQNVLVFQTLSAGIDRWKERILSLLKESLQPEAIVERNDPPVRELEGLPRQKGVVEGGFSPPLEISGLFGRDFILLADPIEGQKTGLFLDQWENYRAAQNYAQGRALDLFCYQGGFALPLATVCEEVTAIDSSRAALEALQKNKERNAISNITLQEANVFDLLRTYDDRQERFDTIVLDPPPFVRDRKNMIGAKRGYKEINLRAMKILNPHGVLITCCCSQNFTPAFFESMLVEAARDAKKRIQILEKRGARSDHPVLLTFPESAYLQCWILRIV